MSLGFCYLAELSSPSFLSDLSDSIIGAGARLQNPWNGKITEIDDEGDQVETTLSDLGPAELLQSCARLLKKATNPRR